MGEVAAAVTGETRRRCRWAWQDDRKNTKEQELIEKK